MMEGAEFPDGASSMARGRVRTAGHRVRQPHVPEKSDHPSLIAEKNQWNRSNVGGGIPGPEEIVFGYAAVSATLVKSAPRRFDSSPGPKKGECFRGRGE